MASRRRAREFALQILYGIDLTDNSPPEALAGFWRGLLDDDGSLGSAKVEPAEQEFTVALVTGVWQQRAEVDDLIEQASLNWRLTRMPVVDRNILRLACYELIHRGDIPVSVTINEAVELAKQFGGADSRAFVNGILDRIAHETGRGGRGPRRGV